MKIKKNYNTVMDKSVFKKRPSKRYLISYNQLNTKFINLSSIMNLTPNYKIK